MNRALSCRSDSAMWGCLKTRLQSAEAARRFGFDPRPWEAARAFAAWDPASPESALWGSHTWDSPPLAMLSQN